MVKNYIKLVISILISLSAGFIGSFFTSRSIPNWYRTLNKPFFNPPDWIFGPVWTVLYILIGISFYIIWVNKKNNKKAMSLFAVQLTLNTLWSIIFFGLKQPFFAFIEIIFLWVSIFFMILEFKKISKSAACILIPYILWVTFAAILNIFIVILN